MRWIKEEQNTMIKKHSNRFVKSIGVNFYLVTTYS